MPFYEYQCKNCGHELEAMQKVSEAPLKKCPHCGKSQLQRLMSAPVFRLKGAGWYETDFKDDKDKKRNLADRPEADSPKDADAKAPEAKTDSASGESKADSAPGDKTKAEPKKPAEKTEGRADSTAKKPAGKRAKRGVKKTATRPSKRR